MGLPSSKQEVFWPLAQHVIVDNFQSLLSLLQRIASGILIRNSTASVTNVASATSSQTLFVTNAARVGANIFNDSTANLFVNLEGDAATTSHYTVKMVPGAYYELPWAGSIYTGQITGIWDAVNGAARCTELT